MLYDVFEFYTLSRKQEWEKKGHMNPSEEKPSGLKSENTAFHMS